MELKRINKKEFAKNYDLLEKDFIFEERRTKENELKCISNKYFNVCFIFSKELNKNIGYFSYWDFDEFIFGEHFAIFEELRNKGYGIKFLTNFLLNGKPFICEIEKPVDTISKKRLKFYKNIGFQILDYKYFQPSYHNSNDKIPMYIIGYNAQNLNMQKVLNTIYKNVYNLKF